MDLTVPYTFYPTALPHWIAWTLFGIAVAGGLGAGLIQVRRRGWARGVLVGVASGAGLLLTTVIASMVITFFAHDL